MSNIDLWNGIWFHVILPIFTEHFRKQQLQERITVLIAIISSCAAEQDASGLDNNGEENKPKQFFIRSK